MNRGRRAIPSDVIDGIDISAPDSSFEEHRPVVSDPDGYRSSDSSKSRSKSRSRSRSPSRSISPPPIRTKAVGFAASPPRTRILAPDDDDVLLLHSETEPFRVPFERTDDTTVISIAARYYLIADLIDVVPDVDTPKQPASFKLIQDDVPSSPTVKLPQSAAVFHILEDQMAAAKKTSKGRAAFPHYNQASKVCKLYDRWHTTPRPSSHFNAICQKPVVPHLPSDRNSKYLTERQLADMESACRDIMACLSYFDHAQKAIQAVVHLLPLNSHNLQNLQTVLLSITDLFGLYMKTICKSTSFLLIASLISRRDIYLKHTVDHLSAKAEAFQDLRFANVSSTFLFGSNEELDVHTAAKEIAHASKASDHSRRSDHTSRRDSWLQGSGSKFGARSRSQNRTPRGRSNHRHSGGNSQQPAYNRSRSSSKLSPH